LSLPAQVMRRKHVNINREREYVMRRHIVSVAVVLGLMLPAVAQAQIHYPNEDGVAMGHVHLIVADPAAAAKTFEAMGGLPMKVGDNLGMRFLDVVILMRQGTPSGPSAGSTVGHIAFTVPNSKAALAQWTSAGLRTSTNSEDKKTLTDAFVKAQLARKPYPGNPGQFFVTTPDGLTRIEILQSTEEQLSPIRFNHVHFYVPEAEIPKIQKWYAEMFGAVPGMRGRNVGADLPGVNLSFAAAPDGKVAPTQGRVIDHIGFEIVNLEPFVKQLEAKGVKFDRPYQKGAAAGVFIAFFTDPWGTTVELSEGLRSLASRR